MITVNGTQARVFHNHELLYNTYYCKQVHQVSDDLYIIEEENKTLTFVYCSSLIMRLDNLLLFRIIPDCGVLVYETFLEHQLGVFYTKDMERLAWFIQEENCLVYAPQGNYNLLFNGYIVMGFSENNNLVLVDRNGRCGYWSVKKSKFIQEQISVAYEISDY